MTHSANATSQPKHWSRAIAEELAAERGKDIVYTCASGITPSGHVHTGNLRDVLTVWFAGQQLRRLGLKVRLLHSWDDFDRFRKVPAGIPDSYKEFIGRPVCLVPDPEDRFPSFAARYSSAFEESAAALGLEIEFKKQSAMYAGAAYGPAILEAVQKRMLIFDIINSFRTDPLPEEKRASYLPIEIYCNGCHKDGTAVTLVDEAAGVVRYKCHACRTEEELAIPAAHNVKLPWKADWPMRWRHEGVVFEPFGKDHGTAGGSFFVSSEISRRVFNYPPPRPQTYEFVGLKGTAGKMSSSAGTVITPGEALRLYQPEVLKWLFAKVPPMRAFDLPVDQQISQVYDEFDKACAAALADPASAEAESLSLCSSQPPRTGLPPFKTVVSLAALLDGNPAAVRGALLKLGLPHTPADAGDRIVKAAYWLEEYAADQRFQLLPAPNSGFAATLGDEEKAWVRALAAWVKGRTNITEEAAQEVFQIPAPPDAPPEQKKQAQRRFFKCVYGLLFGRENGPRLPTFLAAMPAERYLHLLDAVA